MEDGDEDKKLKQKIIIEQGWYIPTLHEKYLKDRNMTH